MSLTIPRSQRARKLWCLPATRHEVDISVQLFADANVALYEAAERSAVESAGFFTGETWMEQHYSCKHCKPARKYKKPEGIVCPYRESQGHITQTRENADRENIHDKTDTTNQTNCRDKFAPKLVRSKKTPHVQHHIQDGHVKMRQKRIRIFARWVSRPTQKLLYPVRLQRRSTRHDVSIRQWIKGCNSACRTLFDVRRGALGKPADDFCFEAALSQGDPAS